MKGNRTLKVDVVFPKRIVRVDEQGLAGGELEHTSDVIGSAPPLKPAKGRQEEVWLSTEEACRIPYTEICLP